MRLLTCRNINKNILLFLSISILVEIGLSFINIYFEQNKESVINNIFLKKIISYFFYILLGIIGIIIRKYSSRKRKGIENYNNSENNINYIYNPQKAIKKKKIIFFILLMIFIYILTLNLDIFFASISGVDKYGSNEYYNVVDIFYLYLLYKFYHKVDFYSHQYLSLVLIAIMELIRYFYKLFILNGISFDFPMDLLSLLPLIVYPFLDAFLNYFLKLFMQYYYFSPYVITFLIGIIYFFISSVLFFPFTYSKFNCEKLYFCLSLTEKKGISGFDITIYIFHSFLNLICFVVRLLVMHNYSVFHLIFLFTVNNLINSIFNLVKNYSIGELITVIITFLIEIFSIFIFLEIIELNFCNLNFNIKRNIIIRSNRDINLISNDNGEDISFGVDISIDEDNNIQNNSENPENIND